MRWFEWLEYYIFGRLPAVPVEVKEEEKTMGFYFGKSSRARLDTCDLRIQEVMDEVIKYVDCTVIHGHRGEEIQNELHRTGKSQLQFPNSKHNSYPSKAIDVVPCAPVDWEDRERMTLFAGLVRGIALSRGIVLRWGGDWDNDWHVGDNKFDDFAHFEILEG